MPKPLFISDEIMTTELYMPDVMNRVACLKHNAGFGIPCFNVPRKDENGYHAGICNKRAKKAGMTGQINPNSLEQRSFTGRPKPRG